ncbi:hypothetical protein C2G38_2194477 [Gigaspora rosea]|uniref:Uncharacterized protein n=1 Tax=Gigaspora rosea TaxID=44941 RepID=A0A397V5R5_9GLOM|nr:hypothetical protein C2G38_2194477 [Gigaspora rosea]
MNVNSTDKLELPDKPKEIKELNITIPIQSAKILVKMARELKKYYFFYKISKKWINIKGQKIKDELRPELLVDINEIKSVLENIKEYQVT